MRNIFRKQQDPMVTEAIDYMDERFPFWLSKVLNIGQPIMDPSVGTAAIQYEKTTGDFTFRMNPEFASTLTEQERAFLMSHEAMHVVRNDMRTHADPQYPDKEALNIAMDAIINDTLTNAGMTAPEWAVNGLRDVGFDCEDADLDDVYQTIIDNRPPPEEQQDPEDGESDEDPQDQEDGEGESDDQSGEDDSEDESDGEDDEQEGGGQSDDDEQDDDADDQDQEGDGEGEGDDSDDDADGEGDEADGETDPTESDDEGEGGDGGSQDTDNEGDDADGGDGGDGQSDQKPMAGGGHEGWGDQSGIEEAADEHEASEGDSGNATGDDGSVTGKKYAAPEGIVREAELDRLDYDEMLNKVEPELVDGFGMGHPNRADWTRPNRRMMGMYPHTVLPSRKDDKRKLALASKRMQLVVFIDNSGSISQEDIALFRKLASRLPKARADYLFVAASAFAVEVSAEDVFNESKPFPNVGDSSSENFAKGQLQSARPDTDQYRTSKVILRKGFRGNHAPPHQNTPLQGLTEFDAMNAWIEVAMEDGRLRSYPKSVMVISDAQTMLTSASEEEAQRWQVFVNRPEGASGLTRTGKGGMYDWKKNYGCKIPQENVHRLGDFLLNETHVRTKQRV